MATTSEFQASLKQRRRLSGTPAVFRLSFGLAADRRVVARFGLILAAVLMLFFAGRNETNATGLSPDYRLGAMDQVRLKVFEWRAAKDEVFEWAALNSEYAIGASGRISLPLIGEVAASGLSINELAKSIGQRLQTRMGLAEAPDIAVEVSKFRPFYLTGAVEKPGEYAYRPGMTVLQAIAVAGGFTRMADSGFRVERELIQTRGDLVMFSKEFDSLLARRARLEAEVKGFDSAAFPASLTNRTNREDSVATLLRQEESIFKARRELFDNQVATLEQLIGYLRAQTKLLEGQISTHDQQMTLVQEERESVTALVKKGLSTQTRRNGIDRSAAQLQGDRLRLQDGLLRVNGELSRTNIALLDLHAKRITEATSELRDVQTKLETIAQRSDTAERLLYETEVAAPMLIADRTGGKRDPVFKIVRMTGNSGLEINANELTAIEPGDTVKVELPRPLPSSLNMPVTIDEQAPRRKLDAGIKASAPQPSTRPALRSDIHALVPSSAPMQ